MPSYTRAVKERVRSPSRVSIPVSAHRQCSMASRALLNLSRPVFKRVLVPSTVRSYATTPIKPAKSTKPVYRAASTSSIVSQAEIDEELLAGTSAPRESVPSSTSLRATAPEANTVFPEQGTAHPPMAATEAPADAPANMGDSPLDWSRSYHGLGSQPFPKEVNEVLLAPVDPLDVEIKPGQHLNRGHSCNR